jgi:hypothetical protein
LWLETKNYYLIVLETWTHSSSSTFSSVKGGCLTTITK